MRFKKPTFLFDEADLETIDYHDEPNKDIFANESIFAAVDKVFDFDKYKKEQATKIDEFKQPQIDDELFVNEGILAAASKVFDFGKYQKEQASALDPFNKLKAENDLEQAETINYVDDLNLDDARENKNTEKHKYRKIRKRKRPKHPTVTFEGFRKPTKKRKRSRKSALITARNISKKYKNLRYR